ncbi:MAG TPA: iron-siderophore ABC transporter substrate-binding protein [Paenibacillus sp.]
MRTVKSSAFILLLLLVLVVSACGNQGSNTKGNASATETTTKDGDISSNGETTSGSTETRTITHALGDSIITGVPKRVVVLEWSYAEDVLALGVQPVGIADIKGMNQWVNIPVKIGPDVTDVGDRGAPNMEIIASLKPDLIIGLKTSLESTYKELSNIAPTLTFEPYPAEGQDDQYVEMERTFNTIADVLGKKAEAETVLKDLDKTYEDAKAKIVAAGKDKVPFTLVMAYSNQNAVTFRISTDNSMAVKILEHIGLTNAHKSDKFEIYGFTTADVEALPALQDANLLHMIQDDDNVIENQLKDNPVWKGLNSVKENRVYALGGDMWPYGGPLSAQIMAQKTADLLTQ